MESVPLVSNNVYLRFVYRPKTPFSSNTRLRLRNKGLNELTLNNHIHTPTPTPLHFTLFTYGVVLSLVRDDEF